jgi:glycosyltransferase involved in cell wall biosynthesis
MPLLQRDSWALPSTGLMPGGTASRCTIGPEMSRDGSLKARSDMTRLCFFNTTRFWGGGEKWHFETADYLASRGHQVFSVVHPGSPLHRRLVDKPIDVLPMAVSNLSFLNALKIRTLARWFRSQQIQTVIFNGSSDVKLGAPAAGLAGVPAVVYRRGLAVPVKNSLLNRWLYGRCITHFLTNSEATARLLFQHLVVPHAAEKTHTIYNGIDLAHFSDSEPAASHRIQCGKIVIGTAGRLETEKGHDRLVAAVSVLNASGLDFELLIAGEGSQRQALANQIAHEGLSGKVRFSGFVTDMPGFMRRIDIFVFPSLWEGFGYAAAEAMAAGRPVVAFDVSCNREVIDHEVSGLLVPPADIEALAGAILRLARGPRLENPDGPARTCPRGRLV